MLCLKLCATYSMFKNLFKTEHLKVLSGQGARRQGPWRLGLYPESFSKSSLVREPDARVPGVWVSIQRAFPKALWLGSQTPGTLASGCLSRELFQKLSG